jgi:hypothetical protein
MIIVLKIPTVWLFLTTEQLWETVEVMTENLRREEVLLVLLCKFAGIKMMAGTTEEDGKKVVHTRFKDAEGNVFDLEDWQVSDFCGRLAYLMDDDMPMDVQWPFRWDRYLMDTSFGDWFHADAMLLRYALEGDIKRLKVAMKDLGDPHDDLQPTDPDAVLLLKWYDLFKGWLQEKYPLVFQKPEPGSEPTSNPVETRQNIMLMLNDNRPQDNEAIERSNVHDVLAALQHKIEEAKHIEEQMSKYKR